MKQPNILFFFPDQHRPDWLGCNKNLPLRTPNIDSLCKNGVRFTNAFTPSPVCSPARACLATGRDYYHCGVKDNDDNTPLSLPTYYQNLRDAGYDVAGVGKFDLHKPDLNWGLDGSALIKEYGFTKAIDNEGKGDAIVAYTGNNMSPKGPYMQFLEEQGLSKKHLDMYKPFEGTPGWLNYPAITELPDNAYCDNWIAENGSNYLKNFSKDRPWHLVVNFVGPHGPFDVTKTMRSKWEDEKIDPPVNNDQPDKKAIVERRQNYAAMIENIDNHVGQMINIVRQRGELDNTIIIYASDHGEMLGDHNKWGKTLWYTPSAGVPLVLSGPNISHGVESKALVSLHDISATLLEYAGAEPIPESEAVSLCQVLEEKSDTHREYVLSGLNNWNMIFDGRYKLIIGATESPILYDLKNDPNECENIADEQTEIVERLEVLLELEINSVKS